MLRQLPNETETDFDDRLAAHAVLQALVERARYAADSDAGTIPKLGARRVIGALERLKTSTSDRAPTWRLLAEVVGLAEAIPPERSAKRVRSALASKGGKTSKGVKARAQHEQIAESWKREILARARALRDAGVHPRNLVKQTALSFPNYSQRQVRRMLKAGDMLA